MAIWKSKRRNNTAGTESDEFSGAVSGKNPSGEQGNTPSEAAVPVSEDWQAKYTAERDAFEKFRREAAAAEEKRAKTDAYRALLGECGIPERHRDRLTKLCDIDSLTFDEDGRLSGHEAIKEGVRADWSELIPQASVPVAKPAMSRGHTLTKESIMAIRNRDARRCAMMNNPELFGL